MDKFEHIDTIACSMKLGGPIQQYIVNATWIPHFNYYRKVPVWEFLQEEEYIVLIQCIPAGIVACIPTRVVFSDTMYECQASGRGIYAIYPISNQPLLIHLPQLVREILHRPHTAHICSCYNDTPI